MDDSEHEANRQHVVAAYYDQLAPVYGEGEYFRARRVAVLVAIDAEVEAARAVLDLGCGNGAYAAEFASRAPAARVVGADLSPDMLHAAQRRLRERLLPVRGDATALPFRAGSFDLVFMSHVLLLVSDIERCVAEVARSLLPGGRLVATVGTSRWRDMVRQFLGTEEWQDMEALFASSGLRAAADDQARVAAACTRVGLRPEWRRAPFSVAWPAVVEWMRIRWLTIADETQRVQAERWLAQVGPRAAELTLEFSETLLVAHRT
jgi:SAM-dependent methyltransferase